MQRQSAVGDLADEIEESSLSSEIDARHVREAFYQNKTIAKDARCTELKGIFVLEMTRALQTTTQNLQHKIEKRKKEQQQLVARRVSDGAETIEVALAAFAGMRFAHWLPWPQRP